MTRAGRGAGRFFLIILAGVAVGLAIGLLWPQLQTKLRPSAPANSLASSAVKPGPRHLTITEQELTSRLRQAVGAQARDTKVQLLPGRMIVTGTVSRQGFQAPVRAELEPYVDQGKLSVRLLSAKLGPLPLPAALTDSLAQKAREALRQQQDRVKGLVVDTVEVKQGEMLLTGHFDRSR
ncbi:MAG TPA: LmeA family phospholipid-binding protein [Armatimonadota bacterium]|jgi:uncharacterized protein YpmS